MSDGNWMQRAVAEFHARMGQPHPEVLDLDGLRLELRAKLIVEEAIEICDALGLEVHVDYGFGTEPPHIYFDVIREEVDWVEVVDGLCDLLYVTFGFAVEAGFSLSPFFAEVHRSNMTKLDKKTGKPVIRESDGKVLKAKTWEPPRIRLLWDRVINRAVVGQRTDGYRGRR